MIWLFDFWESIPFQPEVEKWLEYVCNTEMPKPIRNECNAFVETYGPVVISLLIKQVDPKKICSTIGACPKSQTVLTSFDQNLVASDEEVKMPVAQAPKQKSQSDFKLNVIIWNPVTELVFVSSFR